MVKEDRTTWKSNYFLKITQLFDDFPKCFIVSADNVSSKQMQQIRHALRGKAVVLMGKNTMMRKAIRGHLDSNPALEKLLPCIKNNVGFVFTRDDLVEVRDLLLANKVVAPARAGAVAPLDVKIPAQITTLGPEKTSFFQALQIPTKITKGTIEILNEVSLIKAGEKVGQSECTLLNMLKVSPFTYGLVVEHGESSSLSYGDFIGYHGVLNVAAISLAISWPTMASAPHLIVNGFKRLLAIAVQTDIDFAEASKIKEYLKDPSKFVAAAPVATQAASAPAAAAPAEKEEAKKKEESEESDGDMGFGLFD
ncbi:hypothetical protein C0Q70_07948 [Pomacea canaliculata]|uniref:60S acidic ribosomal protein P0 n=1 Tax=Pomacea canaliculata TaxID=400727 RepID=A0A2T7PGG7_POMCA|nr:hypothetical protein C0Q70_07948 [Pomacea canaliculata]